MSKLIVFNMVSLDGYFVDIKGDMSWAHNTKKDEEGDTFIEGNAKGGGVLLFGRITYELMAGYWPAPVAHQQFSVVAERMNNLSKVVFSRTLKKASWANTQLIRDNITKEIQTRKKVSGKDMVIMGSGSIVSHLTQDRLIDEYQFVIIPIVLGQGRTMFEGIKGKVALKLSNTRNFRNGNALMCYDLKV